MESTSCGPVLSAIIVTPDCYSTIRKAIRHLHAQHNKEQLEVVIVAPSKARLGLDEDEMKGFHGFRVVEVGVFNSTAQARAEGIRHATAPIVALVEDHTFVAPGWAEALVAAHRQGWAAVGPVLANANPRSALSWANLIIEYGPWLEPGVASVVDHLPGHNSSYKRDVLLEYGAGLGAMLDAESILHWDLRAKGHRLYLEPAARTFHLNYSAPLPCIPLRFNGGRLFAAARARHWPLWRRLLFTVAAPLIPLVRFKRILSQMRQIRYLKSMAPRLMPWIVAGLVLDAIGEMAGYASGEGGAMKALTRMEFHRHRYMSKRDRHALNK